MGFFGWAFVILCGSCFVCIVYDCLKDCSLRKKIKYIVIILFVIAVYVFIIWIIRINPSLRTFLDRRVIPFLNIAWLLLFIVSLSLGSALINIDQNTRLGKIGWFFGEIIFLMRFVLIAVLPIYIAIMIK